MGVVMQREVYGTRRITGSRASAHRQSVQTCDIHFRRVMNTMLAASKHTVSIQIIRNWMKDNMIDYSHWIRTWHL